MISGASIRSSPFKSGPDQSGLICFSGTRHGMNLFILKAIEINFALEHIWLVPIEHCLALTQILIAAKRTKNISEELRHLGPSRFHPCMCCHFDNIS